MGVWHRILKVFGRGSAAPAISPENDDDEPVDTGPRWKRILKAVAVRAGLITASVVVTLLVAEVVARLFIPAEVDAFFTPFVHDDSSYRTSAEDPETGTSLDWYIPGATGVTGQAPVKINALGLRDGTDYPAEKPAGCFRVLGIGDSMTFGKGVAEKDTYLAVLERELHKRYPNRCIEVLNAGMVNTNFYAQWRHYKQRWHAFKPDLILVGFFVYNDTQLRDDAKSSAEGLVAYIDRHPWLKKSALIRWIYHRLFFDLGKKALDGLERLYADDYRGWVNFRESVREFKRYTDTQGSTIAFAIIPFTAGYADYPFHEIHERLNRFLTGELRIPSFDIVKSLNDVVAREHWVHPSDPHPDPFLHNRMGQYLLKAMPWDQWMSTK